MSILQGNEADLTNAGQGHELMERPCPSVVNAATTSVWYSQTPNYTLNGGL